MVDDEALLPSLPRGARAGLTEEEKKAFAGFPAYQFYEELQGEIHRRIECARKLVIAEGRLVGSPGTELEFAL